MRPDEELTRNRAAEKKRRSRNRRIKVVLVLVIIVAVISLVFYAIDNPDFLGRIRSRIASIYSPDEETPAGQESIIPAEIVEEETDTAPDETTAGTEQGETTESKGPVFWQKIMAFFAARMSADEEKFPEKLDIKVYFAASGEETKFVYEERTINAGDPKIAVENTMRELLSGPVKPFHYPVIPPGTELLDADIYENIAKINLSQDFLENSLDSGILDEYVIYTIVNTVTQIPDIDGVVFFIDGKRIKVYGNVDLSIPAIQDEKYLKEEK